MRTQKPKDSISTLTHANVALLAQGFLLYACARENLSHLNCNNIYTFLFFAEPAEDAPLSFLFLSALRLFPNLFMFFFEAEL